jgi:putative FmdB family regulatory protein
MPIYEYRCESCGHELEALQKLSDPLLTECPECKQETLKKVLSAAGFRLKGSGWYETDFKGGNKKNVHESSSSSTDKPAGCNGKGCACNS